MEDEKIEMKIFQPILVHSAKWLRISVIPWFFLPIISIMIPLLTLSGFSYVFILIILFYVINILVWICLAIMLINLWKMSNLNQHPKLKLAFLSGIIAIILFTIRIIIEDSEKADIGIRIVEWVPFLFLVIYISHYIRDIPLPEEKQKYYKTYKQIGVQFLVTALIVNIPINVIFLVIYSSDIIIDLPIFEFITSLVPLFGLFQSGHSLIKIFSEEKYPHKN